MMNREEQISVFAEAAKRVGAQVESFPGLMAALTYVSERAAGPLLLPPSSHLPGELAGELRKMGCEVIDSNFRTSAPSAAAALTGADLAIAETGTVILESTDEAVRLATTLPERHFVLVDPDRLVADSASAAPHLRRMHQEKSFLAWITGPSRTADIERVLTIGVHGPRELHILLVEGISEIPMDM